MAEVDDTEAEFVFAKTTVLTIDAANPGLISVRPSESLEVVRVTGHGRLLTSVSEASSNEPVVEDAVVFDSDAVQFLGDDIATNLSHTIIRDATACALVELHVEQSESLEVELRQTYRFGEQERERNQWSSQ